MAGENRRIHALSVVAHAQSELVMVITDFNFYLLCLRVMKCVTECFGSDFVDFITEDVESTSRSVSSAVPFLGL